MTNLLVLVVAAIAVEFSFLGRKKGFYGFPMLLTL